MPEPGQTLTTTTGTWTQSPSSFGYQWNRGGVAIGGATSGSYLIAAADVGTTLTVTVTATNAAGSVPATSAATGTVTGTVSGMSASTLTRTSAVAAYPPTVSFTRPIDWADTPTMYGVMQRSQDPTFATGVTEKELQILAATTTYDFDLDTILSGVWYFRLGAYTGVRPALNFSNIAGVGDAVAPTITSSAAPSGFQFVAGSLQLTANKGGYATIIGGFDMAQFAISASNLLSWTAQATTGTRIVQVQWTSYFGVPSAIQDVTLTVAVNTANAFTFTDVSNATLSTTYTSNTITITIPSGSSLPMSVTGGTYSKNGGAYTATAGTALTGDTVAVRGISGAANNSTTSVVLTVGSTSDTYSVATPAALSTTSAWNNSDKAAGITISGATNLIATSIGGGAFRAVRGTASKASGIRQIEGTFGSVGDGTNTGIGFANATASLTAYIGSDTNGSIYFHGGFISYNGGSPVTGAACIVGDVIGAVWNQSAATVAYYKNGVLQGTVSTANLNATLFPAFCDQGAGNMTLNTGHTTFAHPIAGASAWDL